MGKMEKIKADKSDKAAAKQGKDTDLKQKRLEAIARASTVTFAIEPSVRRFLASQAKASGMNLTHYMQKLVEDHVVDAAPKDDPLGQRLAGKRRVIEQIIDIATKLDQAGKFDEHFILTVVKAASTSDIFKAHYAQALGGKETEGTKGASRLRVSLNQQIGRVIKKAVGARSKRGDAGKITRAHVQDEIVATYTLLEKAS